MTEFERDRDEYKERLLRDVSPIAIQRFFGVNLPNEVDPFWIGEVANALATLYVGYKVGSGIETIANSLAKVLESLSAVLNGIAGILSRIDQILDAIERAVEAISREVNRVAMSVEVGKLRSAVIDCQNHVSTLSKLPPDFSDPLVLHTLTKLETRTSQISDALFTFISIETNSYQRPMSIVSVLNCSYAIAVWARTYDLAQRYYPEDIRNTIWDTAQNSALAGLYQDFFDSHIRHIAEFQNKLSGAWNVPLARYPGICSTVSPLPPPASTPETFRFSGTDFVDSGIRHCQWYRSKSCTGLYTRDPDSPHELKGTYWRNGGVTPAPQPISGCYWATISPSNLELFQDPHEAEAALRFWNERWALSVRAQSFIDTHAPLMGDRDKMLALFQKPTPNKI